MKKLVEVVLLRYCLGCGGIETKSKSNKHITKSRLFQIIQESSVEFSHGIHSKNCLRKLYGGKYTKAANNGELYDACR